MKKKFLVALMAILAVSAGSLLTALPASASATVGTDVASFLSQDISNSVVSHDGTTIAYSGYLASDVWLLDTATNIATEITDPDIFEPGLGSFSPDNATLYVPDFISGAVVVIDVATATVTRTLTSTDFSGPWTSVISPDGNTLYVADYTNGSIVTYNLTNDTSQAVTSVDFPFYLAITPDGSTIHNMDESGTINVFDTATGTITGNFTGPGSQSYFACTSPDVTVM